MRYSALIWHQFKKYPLAYGALRGLCALLILALIAPLLASDQPFVFRVGEQPWECPWLKSLFDHNVYESPLDIVFNALLLMCGPVVAIQYFLKPKIVYTLGLVFAVIACIFAFQPSTSKRDYHQEKIDAEARGYNVRSVYPFLPYGFQRVDLEHVREPISIAHPLGTDNAGRDVMTRMIFGTRISLTIGLFSVALYMLLGTILGALAGYYGGRIDTIVLRAVEVMLSIPSLFLILAMAAFVDKRSIFHVMVIIAGVLWTTPARLVRGEFMRLRHMEFVMAAKAAGFGPWHIMMREMLPNALGPVLVTATFGVASSILIESTVSFLGLGDITVPSWGQILNTGRSTGMWSLILAPGIAIFITVSLLNLVGEGLRDAMDPKMRQS